MSNLSDQLVAISTCAGRNSLPHCRDPFGSFRTTVLGVTSGYLTIPMLSCWLGSNGWPKTSIISTLCFLKNFSRRFLFISRPCKIPLLSSSRDVCFKARSRPSAMGKISLSMASLCASKSLTEIIARRLLVFSRSARRRRDYSLQRASSSSNRSPVCMLMSLLVVRGFFINLSSIIAPFWNDGGHPQIVPLILKTLDHRIGFRFSIMTGV